VIEVKRLVSELFWARQNSSAAIRRNDPDLLELKKRAHKAWQNLEIAKRSIRIDP
jgi:hypothetical protein